MTDFKLRGANRILPTHHFRHLFVLCEQIQGREVRDAVNSKYNYFKPYKSSFLGNVKNLCNSEQNISVF